MKHLISNQILPDITFRDALFLWRYLPWIKSSKKVDFSNFFGTDQYLLTNTARSALFLLLKELHLSKEKKIALPAFCCAVMATPFLTAGYSIEWIDTDQNGLMDPRDFEKKANNISLVIVPHIFGQEAPLQAIKKIAKDKDIIVIEDSAHRLPTISNNHYQLYSFGREKVISCISGGALIPPQNHPLPPTAYSLLPTSLSWITRHLLHPLVYTLARPFWFYGGKGLPWLLQKLKLLPLAVTPAEKKGCEDIPIERLSYPHQKLLQRKQAQSPSITEKKQIIARLWKKHLEKAGISDIIIPDNAFRVILRLDPKTRDKILQTSQKAGFFLREWDGIPISPKGTDLQAFGYTPGQCPQAETFARSYLTLPTHHRITETHIKTFTKLLAIC